MLDVIKHEEEYINEIIEKIKSSERFYVNKYGPGLALSRPVYSYMGGRYVVESPQILLPYFFSTQNIYAIGEITQQELLDLFLKLIFEEFSEGDFVEITHGSLSGYRGEVIYQYKTFCFIYLEEEHLCLPLHITSLRKVSDLLCASI